MKNQDNILKIIIVFCFISLLFAMSFYSKVDELTNFTASAKQEEPDENENDREEDEEEDDDEDEDDDDYKSSNDNQAPSESQTEEKIIYETVTIPEKIEVIEVFPLEFTTDTDDDKLVDAIDPNPQTPESEFFTDDDNDSVPNKLDQHPGDNDFLYIPFTDSNHNGINDTIELR